jgi:hypothetical protein
MNIRFRGGPARVGSPPLPTRDLIALFDHLEDLLVQDACDHTHRHTLAFLAARGLGIAPTLAWLLQHGGDCDCDCAVLERVEQGHLEQD